MVDQNKRNATITKKIIKEIKEIKFFIEGMSEQDFLADIKTQKAVAMTLINIGELSKKYTDDFINSKANIPWKYIQATRNIAAHNYEVVKMSVIWNTITVSLPELQNELTVTKEVSR